jgi:hypothetical protein
MDLVDGELPWRSMTIPDSTPVVGIARLHVDRRTKANVAVVRFPASWSRPAIGHYNSAEQFVVLAGSLEVSGIRYGEGDFAYLPAFADRAESRAPGGCLAVAWFSGPPAWSLGPAPLALTEPPMHGRVGVPPGDAGGGAYSRDRAPVVPIDATTELLWPTSARWCLLPPGGIPPQLPGPVLIRPWQ